MLHDRHTIDKVFEHILPLVPKMDPILAKIDRILEDGSLFRLIRDDLGRRYPVDIDHGPELDPGGSGPADAHPQTVVWLQL